MTLVTLLTQADCSLCEQAKEVLARLRDKFSLVVEEVDLATPRGRELAQGAGIVFAPGVLLDGQPFSYGRLSERRLRKVTSGQSRSPIRRPSTPAPTSGSSPRRRRMALWASLLLGVLLVAFVVVLATRPSALDKQAQSPLLGKPAPDISGASVLSGQAVSLVGLRGRWVVVNFFATWCVPCRQEHPEFVTFAQRHFNGDAQVLMVIYDDTADKVRAWFGTKGGDWPVVADRGGRVALDYGVSGVPETYLVDPQRLLVAKTVWRRSPRTASTAWWRARAQGAWGRQIGGQFSRESSAGAGQRTTARLPK